MNRWALVFGLLLIGLAVAGDIGERMATSQAAAAAVDAESGSDHATAKSWFKTAWIPGFFGIALVICGWLACCKPSSHKHAMHAAAGIALLGAILAGGRAISTAGKLFSSDPDVNRRAATFVLLMAIVCTVYVAMSIASFVKARRSRAN